MPRGLLQRDGGGARGGGLGRREVDAPSGEGVDSAEGGAAFFDNLMEAWESAWPKPRVVVLSFPHNPTSACVDLAFMERLVAFALEHEIIICHDFAYADLGFDDYRPPSILQVPGAKDIAVEFTSMSKTYNMPGWRIGWAVVPPRYLRSCGDSPIEANWNT